MEGCVPVSPMLQVVEEKHIAVGYVKASWSAIRLGCDLRSVGWCPQALLKSVLVMNQEECGCTLTDFRFHAMEKLFHTCKTECWHAQCQK